MKHISESIIGKRAIQNPNPYGLTKGDLIGDLDGFPMGVMVRMLEEQEKQENKPDVTIFQKLVSTDHQHGGFDWADTEAGHRFWNNLRIRNFDLFFKRYPEYKKYNI